MCNLYRDNLELERKQWKTRVAITIVDINIGTYTQLPKIIVFIYYPMVCEMLLTYNQTINIWENMATYKILEFDNGNLEISHESFTDYNESISRACFGITVESFGGLKTIYDSYINKGLK